MQIPGFSDFLMLTTGIIHSDSPKHPVWWPQSRVLTVRCQNLFGLDQTQVGWIFTENCQFFWGGETTPWNCRCCDLIQPTPVMKMFAKSRWRRCPMLTRSQTWHDQKHVAVVRSDGCLYNHPYFERKLGKCSNRFEGCASFFASALGESLILGTWDVEVLPLNSSNSSNQNGGWISLPSNSDPLIFFKESLLHFAY